MLKKKEINEQKFMELKIKIEDYLNTAQQLLKEGNYTNALKLLNKCNG